MTLVMEHEEKESATEGLLSPLGGRLISRTVSPDKRRELLREAELLPRVVLDPVAQSDLLLIGNGGYSPLEGFMISADYRSVVHRMRLASGVPWTLPVVLPVSAGQAMKLSLGDRVALVDSESRVLAVQEIHDVYPRDTEAELKRVYGTTDVSHPGVAQLQRQGSHLLGGPVRVLERPGALFPRRELDPADIRSIIREKGWTSLVGFQTRNPLHRAHEYLVKCALEVYDGLLLHPLVGPTHSEDIPGPVRMACYEALLEGYFPGHRVLLGTFRASMRYAGPREAVFHALVRRNFGCTHFIVGRDHAGVGSFYGPDAAQRIFEHFTIEELGIQPVFFDPVFYCRRCAAMASEKTCPHGRDSRLILSGTEVRRVLSRGDEIPPEFTRPEVARILRKHYEEMRIAS